MRVPPIKSGLALAAVMISALPAINGAENEGYSYKREREFYPVIRRANALLTITGRGLFRVLLNGNGGVWRCGELPATISSWGMFAGGPRSAPFICYYVTKWNAILDAREGQKTVPGIYVSRDEGTTWQLASRREDVEAVFVRENGEILGVFYTTRTEGEKTYHGTTLFLSRDEGRTWTAIKGGPVYSVFPDPEYPERVAVYGHDGIRGVFYRATSADYANWNRVFVDEWQKNYAQTDEEVLRARNSKAAPPSLYANATPVAVGRFLSLYQDMHTKNK